MTTGYMYIFLSVFFFFIFFIPSGILSLEEKSLVKLQNIHTSLIIEELFKN